MWLPCDGIESLQERCCAVSKAPVDLSSSNAIKSIHQQHIQIFNGYQFIKSAYRESTCEFCDTKFEWTNGSSAGIFFFFCIQDCTGILLNFNVLFMEDKCNFNVSPADIRSGKPEAMAIWKYHK